MATVIFSIPDDVKEKFERAFEGQNLSAVVSRLMVRAIEERERKRRSVSLVERLQRVSGRTRLAAIEEIARARETLRE